MNDPLTSEIVMFSPFKVVKKKEKPEPTGNEEYKEYEMMIDEMFTNL
jgi:hypothetical protein